MTRPDVTVSVVSHDHLDEIPHLLEDLAAFAGHNVHEIIVTLNIPEPELANWIEARTWPFVISIIWNPTPSGYGANHNQAFRRCQTHFFCIVNPDVRLSQDPFPLMISTLEQSDGGCAYPMQSDGHGMPVDCARGVPTPLALLRRYAWPTRPKSPPFAAQWINGAFMLFPSSVFKEIGEFDPSYYMYCEDVEICLRLQLRGFRLVPVAGANVEHRAQHASRRRLQHLFWHLQSLWKLWHSESYRQFVRR